MDPIINMRVHIRYAFYDIFPQAFFVVVCLFVCLFVWGGLLFLTRCCVVFFFCFFSSHVFRVFCYDLRFWPHCLPMNGPALVHTENHHLALYQLASYPGSFFSPALSQKKRSLGTRLSTNKLISYYQC